MHMLHVINMNFGMPSRELIRATEGVDPGEKLMGDLNRCVEDSGDRWVWCPSSK